MQIKRLDSDGVKKIFQDIKTAIKPNTAATDGYVPAGQDHPRKIWATDEEGNPDWRDIITDLLRYANENDNIEDTPVGHIIATMDTDAPKHYLVCDGETYNIGDYPYLERHFITKFGKVDYFGSDGDGTYKVPDLRGEFLRGSGTAERNTGSGAAVGVHQAPTAITSMAAVSSTVLNVPKASENANEAYVNGDKVMSNRTYNIALSGSGKSAGAATASISTRPTNTAVLYCIKCEPTYYVNISRDGSPVGTIISFMGTNAPKDYIICDGTTYNISDYPILAQHFETEFGDKKYFGGDGETTFAVPDLRGEFLRGSGTADRAAGSGAAVGVHQDGTGIVGFCRNGTGNGIYGGYGSGSAQPVNHDTRINTSNSWSIPATLGSGAGIGSVTTRPTNTAVLWCIKYQ